MEEPASLLRPDGVDPATVTLPSAGRVVFLVALAAVGLLSGFALVRAVVPRSERTLPAHKLALIQKERPDTIFMGSSRVLRQLDPAVFDRRMAQLGHPTRSFNLGMPQMAVLEQEHVLPEAFRRAAGSIRWVVLDPEFVEEEIAPQFIGTERIVSWHDLGATWTSAVKILTSERGMAEKLEILQPHLQAFLKRLSSFGEAHRLLVSDLKSELPFRMQELAPRTHGFMSLDAALENAGPEYRRELRARRRLLVQALPEWDQRVQQFASEITSEGPVPEAERQAVLRIQELVRARGATPIFLISPGMFAHRNYLRAMAAEGSIEHLIDLGDPRRNPEFYDPKNLYDPNHLNAAGARRFSTLLADLLARQVEEGSIPAPR